MNCFSSFRKNFIAVLVMFSTCYFSCGIEEALKQEYLDEGIWRGVIKTQGQEIPFNFEVVREDSVTYNLSIINGRERVIIRGLTMQGDSVFIPMHIYDAGIKAKLVGNKLIGVYEKYYKTNSLLPFEAVHNIDYRFLSNLNSINIIEGKWEVTFKEKDKTIKALGVFHQEEDKVEGTFLTSAGDYRFLEGTASDNKLHLSSFDGENAFLLQADIISDNELKGHFWSGAFQYQSWHAKKHNIIEEPEISADFIDLNKPTFNFKLIDLNGKMVSLSDEKYSNKIKIINIFGTWSPNSLDGVRFLADWNKKNKNNEVVVLGLAYEQKNSFTYAKSRINKMANRLNAQYELLIAGSMEDAKSLEQFPELGKIESFPITLIVDKNNKIRKIFKGMYGPAAGAYHEKFIINFNNEVNNLITESVKSDNIFVSELVSK